MAVNSLFSCKYLFLYAAQLNVIVNNYYSISFIYFLFIYFSFLEEEMLNYQIQHIFELLCVETVILFNSENDTNFGKLLLPIFSIQRQ